MGGAGKFHLPLSSLIFVPGEDFKVKETHFPFNLSKSRTHFQHLGVNFAFSVKKWETTGIKFMLQGKQVFLLLFNDLR